jgi:YD repeat-containing protein
MIIQKTSNHLFDVITGQPSVTMSYEGSGLGTDGAKMTRNTPAYLANLSDGSNSLSTKMFLRNMFTQPFRTDVYSWDNNAPISSVVDEISPTLRYLDAYKANHRSVAFSQYTQMPAEKIKGITASALANVVLPIVKSGEFKYRQDPSTVTTTLSDQALFTGTLAPANYAGSWITAWGLNFKPIEEMDVLGRYGSIRFDQNWLRPVAALQNARYDESLVLTWNTFKTWTQNVQWYENKQLNMIGVPDGAFNISAPISKQLRNGKLVYIVEASIYSSVVGQAITIGLDDPSTTADPKSVQTLGAGLKRYRWVIDATNYASGTTSQTNFVISGTRGAATTLLFRHVRVYPEGAVANSFVYDASGRIVQAVDPVGNSTYFEYNQLGQLMQKRNDDGIAFSAHVRHLLNRSK